MGVSRDISSHKKMEEAVRESLVHQKFAQQLIETQEKLARPDPQVRGWVWPPSGSSCSRRFLLFYLGLCLRFCTQR